VEVFDQITRWISENESLFSGLAAIVALVAIVPAALRPMLRRRNASGTDNEVRRPDGSRSTSARPRLAVFPIHLTAALLALREGDSTAAERHAREAKRVYPGLAPETVRRIVGEMPAEMLAPWLEAGVLSN